MPAQGSREQARAPRSYYQCETRRVVAYDRITMPEINFPPIPKSHQYVFAGKNYQQNRLSVSVFKWEYRLLSVDFTKSRSMQWNTERL